MPPIAPGTVAPRRLAVPIALLALSPLAGCGPPPEMRQPAQPTAVPTVTGTPATPTTAPVTPFLPAASPAASDLVAVPCRSGPTGDRVVALLRGSARVLPRDVRVTVGTGPLCAGDWHYTILDVAGHEELQVVTRGRPAAPELVTAGTDVCSAEVRAAGPPGIRTLACDGTAGA